MSRRLLLSPETITMTPSVVKTAVRIRPIPTRNSLLLFIAEHDSLVRVLFVPLAEVSGQLPPKRPIPPTGRGHATRANYAPGLQSGCRCEHTLRFGDVIGAALRCIHPWSVGITDLN